MSELVDFLNRMLDEDEATARRRFDNWRDRGGVLDLVDIPSPARVLVEVEAKRAIVSECYVADCIEDDLGTVMERTRATPYVGERILRLLALHYADRPGFDETWRP